MNCQRCGAGIDPGEEREMHGMMVCEDCCMDLMNPHRPCDPWAAKTAKSASQLSDNADAVTGSQKRILDALAEKPLPLDELIANSGLSQKELERDLATLRHMEKVGARLVDGVRLFQLWEA